MTGVQTCALPICKTDKVIGDFFVKVQIFPWLSLKSKVGIEGDFFKSDFFLDPFLTAYGRSRKGAATSESNNRLIWLNENFFVFKKTFGNHKLSGILGNSMTKSHWEHSYGSVQGFSGANVKTLNGGAQILDATTSTSEWALSSFIGRVSYSFKEKYLFTANLRVDGSSRFGKNNKYGYFPSDRKSTRLNSSHTDISRMPSSA